MRKCIYTCVVTYVPLHKYCYSLYTYMPMVTLYAAGRLVVVRRPRSSGRRLSMALSF